MRGMIPRQTILAFACLALLIGLPACLPSSAPPPHIPTVIVPPTVTATPLPTLPPPTAANTAAAATETSAPSGGGPLTVPASLYGPAFSNITISGDHFSLRCEPKTITFDVTASDIYITVMEFYYRIRDKHSTYVPEWSRGDSLVWDGGGHFFLTFSGEAVTPDNRKADGWFDIQFVGLNKLGQVVNRTEKIIDLVTYTIDCP